MTAPEMPLSATKKAFVAELKAKHEKKNSNRPTAQVTQEVADFVGKAIEAGLQKRVIEEELALQQYQ